ncbi:hypothetical protein NL676_022932 [Syzygium grande]|nr:hypothetical protein NL676_022932 [Syzygium grande]
MVGAVDRHGRCSLYPSSDDGSDAQPAMVAGRDVLSRDNSSRGSNQPAKTKTKFLGLIEGRWLQEEDTMIQQYHASLGSTRLEQIATRSAACEAKGLDSLRTRWNHSWTLEGLVLVERAAANQQEAEQ